MWVIEAERDGVILSARKLQAYLNLFLFVFFLLTTTTVE